MSTQRHSRTLPRTPPSRHYCNPSILPFLLLSVFLLTGCYTYTQAAGATGTVIDADTGAPVPSARITRPFIAGGTGTMGIPSEGLPSTAVSPDKSGRFNLPPATHNQMAFMHLKNPKRIPGSFTVTADGYATNQLHGVATSRSFWRVELGKISLSRP